MSDDGVGRGPVSPELDRSGIDGFESVRWAWQQLGGYAQYFFQSPELLPCPADALESVYSRPVELGADRAPPHSVIAHLAMLGVRSGRRPRTGSFFCQSIPPPDPLQ